jgi:hypothetical protein
VAVRGLDRDPELARRLVDRLSRRPEVRRVSPSPLTGRVLIELAERATTIQELLTRSPSSSFPRPRALRGFRPIPWIPPRSSRARPRRSARDWGCCCCSRDGSPEQTARRSPAPARARSPPRSGSSKAYHHRAPDRGHARAYAKGSAVRRHRNRGDERLRQPAGSDVRRCGCAPAGHGGAGPPPCLAGVRALAWGPSGRASRRRARALARPAGSSACRRTGEIWRLLGPGRQPPGRCIPERAWILARVCTAAT